MRKLNTIKVPAFFFLLVTLLSCQTNEEIEINPTNLLIGYWGNAIYENETTTFQRINSLPDEGYGVAFKENDVFIERTSGWCGTPPLSFFNIEGTWQKEEALIMISSNGYLGNYTWRIISLDETQLVIKRELSEQELDHRALMALADEFYAVLGNNSCDNSNDWNFTAYGAKACGGPQGYIAYPNQIDTVAFLQKVAEYTEAENQYNIKWGIVSTCDITPTPIGVECINGLPVLKY
ncbi:MAG: hypothetical protein JKY02_11095 [Flavobacteriaceae bacterium]|nr:hypothetical protein [Flavobacteriaceae bacterium]